jgi:hypothetical protein
MSKEEEEEEEEDGSAPITKGIRLFSSIPSLLLSPCID